jgi:CRISPR-associated protein Csb2
MFPLILGWQYLTGCCVATDVSDRRRPEWPPHPARIFMALAATWFETGRDASEGAALKWLESLGDPEFRLPHSEAVFQRSTVDVFVPVNDKAGPSNAILQSAPTLTRDRQPRTFPSTWVGDAVCYAQWNNVPDLERHTTSLGRLCSRVTRIGHSSSLVRMWVAAEVHEFTSTEVWHPDEHMADIQVRRTSSGTLGLLEKLYGEPERQAHEALTQQIGDLELQQKMIKGKGAKERKAAIDAELVTAQQRLADSNPRPPIRPRIGLWTGYRRVEAEAAADVAHSHFDTDLVILGHQSGPRLPLESTLQVTRALRAAVMKSCGNQPPPEWISGHVLDGTPSVDQHGHLALIPLPFVGHQHADGHLLGLGLALPRSVDRRERGRRLGPWLVERNGQSKPVELRLGSLGVWVLAKRNWSESRGTLNPASWTSNPMGANTWASVTPVVLDRFPKGNRREDPFGWTQEVIEIVSTACVRIGLPKPAEVDIDTTAWHQGVPRSTGRRRPLRGGTHASDKSEAALGDGFPNFPAKGTNASRPQVHVWLRFDQPVLGPQLIGAGRYLGYGLLKPVFETRKEGRS